MAARNRWRPLREHASAWTLSLAIHVALLIVLGMITWVVIPGAKVVDAVLTLGPEGMGSGPGGAGGRDATGGSAGDTAEAGQGKARPGGRENASDSSRPLSVPQAPPASVLARSLSNLRTSAILDALSAAVGEAGQLGLPGLTGQGDSLTPGQSGLGGDSTGILAGTSGGFGKHIGGLRASGLDLVLVLDATDSMSPYIDQGKKRLQQILDVVTGLVPNARVGMVAYKDYGDEYGPKAVRSMKLTDDVKAIREFIDSISAGGGGDIPEPIHEALLAATDGRGMQWLAGRQRVIILVGDSPNHPQFRQMAIDTASRFHRQGGGTISVIDVGGSGAPGARRVTVQPDLNEIAKAGGGSAFLLQDRDQFWRHLIVAAFGRQYENDVNTIIDKFVKE